MSSVQSVMWTHTMGLYSATPDLAVSFVYFDDADFWAPAFEHMEFERLPQCDFHQDDRVRGVFAHDWREGGISAWQGRRFDRVLGIAADRDPGSIVETLVMGRSEFAASVRQALKDLNRPERLDAHPGTRKAALCLRTSFVEVAPTQSAAAERAGIPFSTYRRQLAGGIEAVVESLWRDESA